MSKKPLKTSPGPFTLREDRNQWDIVSGSPSGYVITCVSKDDEYGEPDEDPGNAHLLAASWDLFEACKAQHKAIDILFAMLIECKPGFFPTKSGVWDACVQGNDAIAKAEGRS